MITSVPDYFSGSRKKKKKEREYSVRLYYAIKLLQYAIK